MTSEERDLITGLFDRLRTGDTQPHDAEAENLIRQSVASQPGAPYLFVQTLLVQEHALVNAQARIKALEQQLASAPPAQPAHSGGFLSGLFGGSTAPAPTNIAPRTLPAAAPMMANPPYPSTVNMPATAGGGFLRSALSTAAGVAGGAMLFQGIEDLLGHRSGAFGSGLGGGGGGFMDTGFGGRPEIVNNYFGDAASREPGSDPNLQSEEAFQNANTGSGTDDFPASVDLGNDASANDASTDFGSSNDDFGSGSNDFSSDDSGNSV